MNNDLLPNGEVTGHVAEPIWDAFLLHAAEDKAWCERLADRLRDRGVRIWFEPWQLPEASHPEVRRSPRRPRAAARSRQLPEANHLKVREESLKRSRKLIVVWSASYFADHKVKVLAKAFVRHHPDALARERLLIPVVIGDCEIPHAFQDLIELNFRSEPDFDLNLQKLIEALDLPRRGFTTELAHGTAEHERSRAVRGREAHAKGKQFEDHVATLYRVLGYGVKLDTQVGGMQIDLQVSKREGGTTHQMIIECKDCRITSKERDQLLAQQNVMQRLLPRYRWIAVSSVGFAADTRTALETAGFDCTTYTELLNELVPLGNYVEGLIREYRAFVADPKRGWAGRDLFIRPDIETDVAYERMPALAHLSRWLNQPDENFLVVLGDLGTGKTRLLSFLAYHLARGFREDPLRHPAPVLIPLGEMRKEVALESIVIKHFRDRGLVDFNFSRFMHLVRLGRIVVFFDAFDEMADRIRSETTLANFQELRRAAVDAGKALLTCRTHYFKDRMEQQRIIGEGPSLSAAETALYKELRQQSNAAVVYLQEFSAEQILDYLRKVRGASAEEDWAKIQSIYNLRDLAQRPLLLEMIVKSLPQLHAGEAINAASLYTVYTNLWVARDFEKGRVVLDRATKLELMTELAWSMWREEKSSFSTQDLMAVVSRLHATNALDFREEETEHIVSEVQAASFLRRERTGGHFVFIHRSFGEFFLARRLHAALSASSLDFSRLEVRRLDQKTVYFLALLDAEDTHCATLQSLLTAGFQPSVSENALQILYWSGRVRCGMEEQVRDMAELQRQLAVRLPVNARLGGARLQAMTLEGATFARADFSTADLSGANLNDATFSDANLSKAVFSQVKAERLRCQRGNFREATLTGASFAKALFEECDFTQAALPENRFLGTELQRCHGLAKLLVPRAEELEPVIQLGPSADVRAVAWSAKADLLATAGGDGIIRLYWASDGRLLHTLKDHQRSVWSVAFDQAGGTLASGGLDGKVRLWEAQSGRLLRILVGHQGSVQSVAFDPAGGKLASGGLDGKVRLWEAQSGRLLHTLEGHKRIIRSVAFDPAGSTLASGGLDGKVRLWAVHSGRLLHTLEGHQHIVQSVAFNPTGSTLASGDDGGKVRLWEAQSGRLLHILDGHQRSVQSVAFDPAGSTLASGSLDGEVRLWEAQSGRLLRILEDYRDNIWSVAFDSAGSTLASGGLDGKVRLWAVHSGRLLRVLEGYRDNVWSVAFDPTGNTLASGGDDGKVRLWEAQSGRLLRTVEFGRNPIRNLAFDAAGRTLASGGDNGTMLLWETQHVPLLRTLAGHRDAIWSVAFASGSILASGGLDSKVRLWQAHSGRLLRTLEGHQGDIWSVAFDPAGSTLASGGLDGKVRLWEAQSGRLLHILDGNQGSVRSVAFDPAGSTLASGGIDGKVRLWEAQSGRLLRTLAGRQGNVWSVAFDPIGGMLASGGGAGTVCLWETQSGRLLRTLESHQGGVWSVAFGGHGAFLVTAGTAGRLRFWDLATGDPFLDLYTLEAGAWLALLPDGRFDGDRDALRHLCYTQRGTLLSIPAEQLRSEFHAPSAIQEALSRYH